MEVDLEKFDDDVVPYRKGAEDTAYVVSEARRKREEVSWKAHRQAFAWAQDHIKA